MPEEEATDDGHHQELFDQLLAQIGDGAVDELGAVVGRHHLDACRQALLQFVELGLHRGDGLARILAGAENNHAARHLALAIELGDAATHLRSKLDGGDLAEGDRDTTRRGLQRDRSEVIEGFEVAAGADHILGLRHRKH